MVPPPERSTEDLLLKLAGVFLGIMIFAGLLAYHAIFFVSPPGTPPTTDSATVAYRNTIRVLAITSMALLDLAAGFSVTLAWVTGTTKGETSESGRRGIFVFATVYTAVWLVFSTFILSSFLFSLIRFY